MTCLTCDRRLTEAEWHLDYCEGCFEQASLDAEHVAYPHWEGYLLDCPACEARCHCTPGSARCVYEGEHSDD